MNKPGERVGQPMSKTLDDKPGGRPGGRVVVALLVMVCVLGVAVGARLYLGESMLGWPRGEHAGIIVQDRVMRMLIGLIVGVGLSVSGVSLQTLLRNPLAEPYILGLSTGAGAGIMVQSYLYYLIQGEKAVGTNALGAVLGAAVVMLIVFLAGRRRGVIDPLGLLLTGVVLSTICGALILMMNYLVGPGGIRDNIARWMMGSLHVPGGSEIGVVWVVGSVTAGGLCVLIFMSRAMDVATASDAEAVSLGVNLSRLRVVLFAVSSLLAAGAVVLAGPIAFVGLICPHIARLVLGPRHGPLLIGSALLGAALVITADTASAMLNLWLGIGLMPIGIFTAIVGGPAFLWMLRPQLGRGQA
jgi:ABC-type Fe3+-siderophore transport system permease subunit